DIEFKNLGLLIIDEEQRFGVAAKEKIKQLRVNVDVLALSATPIPRTLQMSLLEIRDMSLINTPPRDRLPIHTETIEFDPRVIRQAMLHELQRGGQIYFVHNRIQSIDMIARRIKEIVPEADIAVAHGQMNVKELEHVMHDFMQKKYHILISTMIIESGLDIPNVNTIFINRADKFGLAQLYQLRGRVGRSNRKAYCYLIIPPLKKLTREAIQRLETVEEFTELGSGFHIAMRDLEIRGAGSILGGEQSGFIESLGIDLYMKILDEAIKEFQHDQEEGQEEKDFLPEECRVEADVDAYLPQKYVSIPSERVEIYRQVAHARDHELIEDVREELKDRYGRLPAEAENMLNIAIVSLLGRQHGFGRIVIKKQTAMCVFHDALVESSQEQFKALLGKMVLSALYPVELFQDKKTGIKITFPDDEDALFGMKAFLVNALSAENPETIAALDDDTEQEQKKNNGDRTL
ncbi:MAG TPA: transcription-repair coupling factor, partial [Bacteroidetes bacterium]|nr:transcription-repair coupling factor [Bacteroidota bacterium]